MAAVAENRGHVLEVALEILALNVHLGDGGARAGHSPLEDGLGAGGLRNCKLILRGGFVAGGGALLATHVDGEAVAATGAAVTLLDKRVLCGGQADQ